MDSYRVFVSYSHQDRECVRAIVDVLQKNGLTVMWDQDFVSGQGFDEQIKGRVNHAHVFLPLITPNSMAGGWVHQEIGYAMALNVPVLPVCVGEVPGEMLQPLHAVCLKEDLSDLAYKLPRQVFENLVQHAEKTSRPLYQCAMFPEERADMIVEYSQEVLQMGARGCVRQMGALSSFQTPNRRLSHPIWRQRYGNHWPGDHHCRCLREERRTLEKHARHAGCKLLIKPHVDHSQYGSAAIRARLEAVVEFLDSMPDDGVVIAVNESVPQKSVTIVGDWFMVESVMGKLGWGYQHSTFTRHAPTVRKGIEAFDRELEEILQESAMEAALSRTAAIDRLKQEMANLEGE